MEIRDIIVQHQGMITVSPEPGRGTAFDIYLPTALPLETPAISGAGSHIKHIVYVDDYEAMRSLVSDTLPDAGFRVTCYESGSEALAALQGDPLGCDVVVSDYRLPGSSGIEFLKQVKRLRADLPVIIISGYVNEALRAKAHDEGAALVMSKAHDLSELCVALRELLGHAPHPALVTYSDWAKL
ncbi:response regulator [Polaromonas sp. P1(28)-13]|nr:response regulator [Polaromonas sp. P1(28)-13]